ncbi:MAG: hypothetical protein COV07_02970 [Candidatus Vogelbacteria bacterium CG10_big_fil_rev_8_21_14_0_10_45_14]|uniref:Uncharacterized protein n=1 Tax=Candidatus Vogelbacteria bacterium CG10_big_fil_rev_8_21_14_0_10_45_14 TaxID=1975042 RepID=A0A2H0RLL4_9BACT|nr:MAG: hypothetical protein COV07_02970 [Candidatus Vogelbacteria bacterium CG10_big_fil_rev_8_21_14_0_10_45_14]
MTGSKTRVESNGRLVLRRQVVKVLDEVLDWVWLESEVGRVRRRADRETEREYFITTYGVIPSNLKPRIEDTKTRLILRKRKG